MTRDQVRRNREVERVTTVALIVLGCWMTLAILPRAFAQAPAGRPPASRSPAADPRAETRLRFENARFGLSFEWGVFALLGKGEAVMENDKLPIAQYEKLPPRFNPSRFDAESWVRQAKGAGAGYIVVTCKGRDGFCMFDSRLTRYDIVDATPYAKDPLKTIAEAARKHQIMLMLAYSLIDSHHPDAGNPGDPDSAREAGGQASLKAYVAYYQGQIRELCTNYGEIGGIWLDGGADRSPENWELAGTYRMIRELQPTALIRGNFRDSPLIGQDVHVLEASGESSRPIASNSSAARHRGKLAFETRLPLGDYQGYHSRDPRIKPVSRIVRAILQAAGEGANLTLGIGPRPDGSLDPEIAERLDGVGKWLTEHGKTVQGTRPGSIPLGDWGVSLAEDAGNRPATHFLHIDPAKLKGPLILPREFSGHEITTFETKKPLLVKTTDRGAEIEIPESERTPIDIVVVVRPKNSKPRPWPR